MIAKQQFIPPWLAMLMALVLVACQSPATPTPVAATPATTPPLEELARHYAPVIYQGAATDADFITAVDFDGDWIGNNNWEHQPAGDLRAVVYQSVIETETHWYLFYALYHPRDYTDDPCAESDGCHENDMESLEVVVRKDGARFGRPEALFTLAHNHINLYAFEGSGVKKGGLKVKGKVRAEEGHPIVWVETFGHGIYGKPQALAPGKVIYRVGDAGERPESIHDDQVAYALVPIYDTLWARREELGPGKLFDKPFDYRGVTLPAAFDGEDWGEDKANPPWGYDQETDHTPLQRGDFFLDPAKAYVAFAHPPQPLSQNYLINPFLDDITHPQS